MFRPGKLVHGSPLILFLLIGLTLSAPPSQRETRRALSTISRFLKSKTGSSWLAGLSQTKSGPLTTVELMNQLIKSTKPNGKVSKSAWNLRKALDIQKSKKGDSDDGPDAWDDLVKDIENQDDIICLYRKDSDSSMRKADDWKKFLKSVSNGYTVHLALDKGKKYVICLKKIPVPEADVAIEVTTQEVPLKVTSEKPDLEGKVTEPESESGEEIDNLETTTKSSLVETTEINEIGEREEKPGPKLKLPETRKSRYGPSADDIEDSEEDDDEEEECSEEYDSDEDNEGEEDKDPVDAEDDNSTDPDQQVEKAVAKAVEDDAKKFEHPQCNRPIIVVMQNPYGPNSIYSIPQNSKNPLQPVANQLPKFSHPSMQPNYNPWNKSKFRYPFVKMFNKYPKFYYPKHAHHPRHFRPGYLPRNKSPHDHKYILNLSKPRSIPEGHKSHRIPELKNSQNLLPGKLKLLLKSHNTKPPRFQFQSRKSSKEVFENPEDILEPGQNWTSQTNLGPNNFDLPISWPRVGPNLAGPLMPIRPNYPNKGGRYNPFLINQLPCLPGSSKKSPFNPQGQKCLRNPLWKPLIGNSRNPRVWNPYWFNQLNKQPWFNNQQIPNRQIIPNQVIFPDQQILPDQPSLPNKTFLPDQSIFPNRPKLPNKSLLPGQLIFPNQPSFPNQLIIPNQLIFPNQPSFPNQPIFPNQQILPNQPIFPKQLSFPNPETSLASLNSCKCPSLCDKPIELKITVEGNVDKPVKIGILSQPGTWVNIVGNNNEEKSRRMLERNEKLAEESSGETAGEDEAPGSDEMDETDDSQSVTENFTDELIENPDKADKKKETGGADKDKNVEDQKKDTDNKEQEENKAEEVETRALPEITTVPDIKPTETTEITASAA